MIDDPFLSETEAAALLGLKRTTLESWRMRGGGPEYAKLGKAVRYRRSVIEAFIAERTRRSTSEQAAA